MFMIEVMKLTQYLFLMFFWGGGVINILYFPWTLLVFEFRLGISETLLCSLLARPTETVHPSG